MEYIPSARPITPCARALAGALGGMAIVVADVRSSERPLPHPEGRGLPGGYGHGAGLDSVLRGGTVRVARSSFGWRLPPGVALVGVLIAAVSRGRPVRRILFLRAEAAVRMLVCLFAYHELRYFVNPLVALVSTIIACELAVRVSATRGARVG